MLWLLPDFHSILLGTVPFADGFAFGFFLFPEEFEILTIAIFYSRVDLNPSHVELAVCLFCAGLDVLRWYINLSSANIVSFSTSVFINSFSLS
jgi:hypothetical protein